LIAKLRSAAVATAVWLACVIPLYGCFAIVEWATAPTPFSTMQQCQRALRNWQYDNGHGGELCVELEGGGWCVYDDSSGDGHCILGYSANLVPSAPAP
jgi:hypothetical protein